MKKEISFVFLLACFVSAGFPSGTDISDRVIVGGTTGTNISVRDFEILPTGKWTALRELEFVAPGPVGTIAATPPNSQEQFSVYFTYQDQSGDIQGRNVRIDYENLAVLSNTALNAQYGNFSLGALEVRSTSPNRIRLSTVDEDVFTQKVRTSNGKPFVTRNRIFDNDSSLLNTSTSFSWNGDRAAQLLFHSPTGNFFGDFRALNNAGKPQGNPVRFSFPRSVFNVSVGLKYDFSGGAGFYNVATREVKRQGSIDKTGVFINQLDASTNFPIGNAVTVSAFKKISPLNLQASFFNTTFVYDIKDENDASNSRAFVIYGEESGSCHKLITRVRQFDPFTLVLKKPQTLVGCNDLGQESFFYGNYAVGFMYED